MAEYSRSQGLAEINRPWGEKTECEQIGVVFPATEGFLERFKEFWQKWEQVGGLVQNSYCRFSSSRTQCSDKFDMLVEQVRAPGNTKTVFRNLLDLSGKVEVTATSVVVTLDKRAHNPYLVASGLTAQPTPMPWFGDKKLIIQFA